MSTHATISVQHNDNTVSTIYLHSDGYINYTGVNLVKHYNSLELAEQLISGGDISVLGERIDPIGEHSFDNRENGTTVYYKRDRGESNVEPQKYSDIEFYQLSGEPEEFNYIFTEGDDTNGNRVTGWFVSFGESKRFQLVTECLAECVGE